MRILYNNLIDDLAASRITALTEEALYGASNVQDQRLTTQWHTTSPTSQTIIFAGSCDTIVGGNIGLVTGSAATNLVTDPENMSSANWIKNNVSVTTAQSILGYPAYDIEATSTSAPFCRLDLIAAVSTYSASFVVRKNDAAISYTRIYNASSASDLLDCRVTFATKTVAFAAGSQAIPPQWIDDSTVRVFANVASAISIGNALRYYCYSGGVAVTGQSTIFSMPFLIANAFPVPYVATSRSAINTSYNFRLPPSGKFIIDCEFFPFLPYDIGSTQYPFSWKTDSTHFLAGQYNYPNDKFYLLWQDGGTLRQLESARYGGAYRTLNDRLRMTTSLDLSAQAQTGSMLFMNGTLDDSDWTAAPDAFATTTFTTLYLASLQSLGNRFDGIFRYFRIYGGVFTSAQSTITTEAEIDAALANHQLLFDQTYQRQFDFDTVAILGHNIEEGASVIMQANDWNEWNYVDGSGSSIIQHALAWDNETILKMITATKKQYVKFTINDPNNTDGKLKIGRFWIGRYLDIDPASLDSFTVSKKRTDDVTYGVNMQKFAALGTGYREFDLKFPPTNSTMVTAIQTMYDAVGNHSSIIFANFDTLRDYELVEPVYCSIVGDISFTHHGRQKYDYALKLQENK